MTWWTKREKNAPLSRILQDSSIMLMAVTHQLMVVRPHGAVVLKLLNPEGVKIGSKEWHSLFE
jgi:hypothetical protein